MRYLRHGPLTFYLVLVIATATLLGFALARHATTTPPIQYGSTPDRIAFQSVLDRMGELKAIEAAPASPTREMELTQWARSVASTASVVGSARSSAYGSADPLAHAWRTLYRDATQLEVPGSTQLADAGRLEGEVNSLETLLSLSPAQRVTTSTLPTYPNHSE